MNSKIKKIIAVITIFLSVLAVIFIFISVKKNTPAPTINPIKPSLSQKYKGQYSIEFDVNQKDFQYIDKLPLLEIEKSIMPDSKAREIAESLKFSGSPISVNDQIDGLTYFWKNEKATLFVYPKQNEIKYTLSNDNYVIDKQLSDKAIVSLAMNFLEENKIVEKNSLSSYRVKFLKKNPSLEGFVETTKTDSSIYEVEFVFQKAGYEIVEPSSIEPLILVDVTKGGTVSFVRFKTLGTITTSLTEYRLKDFKEIEGSIKTAVLISVLGQYLSLSDLPDKLIQKVTINKIELAYLHESASSVFLQPVYKLSGEADISSSPNKVPAVLYLPAIKEN